MDYSIETHGLTDFGIRFRAVRELRDQILEALTEASREAGLYMTSHVPYHTGLIYRAINVGNVIYMPGGAGGGGYYEVHVGVDEATAPHTEFVIEGTGLYNREGGRGLIYPARGNVIVFEAHGEKIFTRYTRGQRPRREWFEDAQDVAREVIERKIAGI